LAYDAPGSAAYDAGTNCSAGYINCGHNPYPSGWDGLRVGFWSGTKASSSTCNGSENTYWHQNLLCDYQ